MVEKSLTSKPPYRTREMKRRQAEYSARHREKMAGLPDSRVIDRTLIEALGVYLTSLPREQTAAILPALVDLAAGGLVYAAVDQKVARKAIGKRLKHLLSSKPGGTVRTGKLKSELGHKPPAPSSIAAS